MEILFKKRELILVCKNFHYYLKCIQDKNSKSAASSHVQIAMFVPFTKLVLNVEKFYQIFNFSLF